METTKIWLVTGASQGLGLLTVKYLLSKDQTVIATTRDKNKFDPAISSNPNLEIISLDLTSEGEVKNSINKIVEKYGRIDVLINNAGHGFVGAVEEASAEEVEQVMAVNVFATLRMIRCVLPYMRHARNGRIINLSSMAGLISSPGWGIYNASKYAVEGFSEALSHELKDLGIKVIIIEPGAFRTHFLDSSLTSAKQMISDYDTTAGATRKRLAGNNGNQPNDPEKAAIEIYNVGTMDNPPLRLLLGQDAYNNAIKKTELLKSDFERMKEVTLSTGF